MGPQPEGQPESHLMEEGRAEVNVSVREKIGNNTLGLGFSPPSTLFSKKHQALCGECSTGVGPALLIKHYK